MVLGDFHRQVRQRNHRIRQRSRSETGHLEDHGVPRPVHALGHQPHSDTDTGRNPDHRDILGEPWQEGGGAPSRPLRTEGRRPVDRGALDCEGRPHHTVTARGEFERICRVPMGVVATRTAEPVFDRQRRLRQPLPAYHGNQCPATTCD